MNEQELLFALIRAEVCGEELRDGLTDGLTPELLAKMYRLAGLHDLAHIPGYALKKLGMLGEDGLSNMLEKQVKEAAYRYIRLDMTCEQLCAALEQASIPFVLLKGTVLRQYYPEPWMRTSCDIDVLVREEQLDAAVELLCEKLVCQRGKKGDHDIVLRTAGGVAVELHYDTIQARYALHDSRTVLGRIWEYAKPDQPGSAAHHMSDEMFYFYHIAHMAKHFGNGGCGVRPFLDVWILNHRVDYAPEKREALLREGGLLTFARGVEALSEVWFSGEEPDGLSLQMADYILRAGVYGNNENRAAVGQARMGGKLRYVILRRVFMPYDYLKAEYPILKKHKWLCPFYQIVRWTRLLKKGLFKKKVHELQANAGTTDRETREVRKMLKQLGI